MRFYFNFFGIFIHLIQFVVKNQKPLVNSCVFPFEFIIIFILEVSKLGFRDP